MEAATVMSGDQFDKWMRRWMDREVEAAPEIQPPEYLRQRVRTRAEFSRSRLPRTIEWAAAALAGAALILLAIHLPGYLLIPISPDAAIQELVGLRTILPTGPPPGGKGRSKKGGGLFRLLLIQRQSPGAPGIETRDMCQPGAPPLRLGRQDNYRLVIQGRQELYLTVFQVAGRERMARLFPNERLSPRCNPIRAGDPVEVPPDPQWLFANPNSTPGTLVVVASDRPIPELERIYSEYLLDSRPLARKAAVARLLTLLGSWQRTVSGTRQVIQTPIESGNL
jgi:hypothetical protein